MATNNENASIAKAQEKLGTPAKFRPVKVTYAVSSLGPNIKTILRTEQWPDRVTGEMKEPRIRYIAQCELLKNDKGYPIDLDLTLDLEQLKAFKEHIEEIIDFVENSGYQVPKRVDKYSKMEELKKLFS
jgi:hypothetical protein